MGNRWREWVWLALALAAGALLAVMQARGGAAVLPTLEVAAVATITVSPTSVVEQPVVIQMTPSPVTSTPDPFELTATFVVGQATAQASIPLTLGTRAVTTPATLDPFELTATHIVGRATAQAGITLTQRAQTTQTPGPLELTAIAQATTPHPTPNARQLGDMEAELLEELETAAGFSHPVFSEIVNGFIYGFDPYNGNIAHAYDFYRRRTPLFVESTSTQLGDERYIVLIVRRLPIFNYHTLLMFRRTASGRHILLPVPENQRPFGAYIYTFDNFSSWNDNDLYPLGFADRNGNDLPDLAVEISTGGNGGQGGLLLFEIAADGSIVDLTPYPADTIVRNFADLEEDGVLEIVAQRCIPHPLNDQCNYNYWSGIERYFGWGGESYVDISGTVDADIYYPQISRFWNALDETSNCVLPSLEMYEMLVAAYIRGELDEQWTRLQPFLRWGGCSSSSLQDYRIHQSSLVRWVEQLPDIATNW